MASKKQVVQSGVWQMLNVGVKVFSQFAYFGVMARLLSQPEMGVFALLNSFMNIGNILGDGGMGDALLQRKDFDKQHINAAFYSSLLISFILYVALYIASPFIADFYAEPMLNDSLRIFGIVFLFAAMYSASMNMLQKNFRFKKIFVGDGVCLLLSNILGIVLAYKGVGVMSLVWSQLFYFGTKLIVFWYYSPVPLAAGTTKKHWNDLLGYGTGLTLIRINNYIANFGIVLEVGKLVSKALLGVFDRTYRIMNIPQRFLYDVVQRIMMPAMVSKSGSDRAVFSVFSKTLSLMNTVMLPLTVFLIIFCKPVVLILLGPKWLNGVLLMQICFLSLPMRMSSSLGDTLMRVHGLIKINLYRKIINSIAVFVFIYVGFILGGLTGIGWAVFASTVFSYLQMILVIRKRIYPDQWKGLLLAPYKSGAAVAIGWVLPLYLLYFALGQIIKTDLVIHQPLEATINYEVLNFSIVTLVAAVAAAYAFIKKPKLLGADIAYIQPDLLNKGGKKKGGKGGKKRKQLQEQGDEQVNKTETKIVQDDETLSGLE